MAWNAIRTCFDCEPVFKFCSGGQLQLRLPMEIQYRSQLVLRWHQIRLLHPRSFYTSGIDQCVVADTQTSSRAVIHSDIHASLSLLSLSSRALLSLVTQVTVFRLKTSTPRATAVGLLLATFVVDQPLLALLFLNFSIVYSFSNFSSPFCSRLCLHGSAYTAPVC